MFERNYLIKRIVFHISKILNHICYFNVLEIYENFVTESINKYVMKYWSRQIRVIAGSIINIA